MIEQSSRDRELAAALEELRLKYANDEEAAEAEEDDHEAEGPEIEDDAEDDLREEEHAAVSVKASVPAEMAAEFKDQIPAEHIERHLADHGNKLEPGKTWQGDDREGVYKTAPAVTEVYQESGLHVEVEEPVSKRRRLVCDNCRKRLELSRPWPCEYPGQPMDDCRCSGCNIRAVHWPSGNQRQYCSKQCAREYHAGLEARRQKQHDDYLNERAVEEGPLTNRSPVAMPGFVGNPSDLRPYRNRGPRQGSGNS